MRYVIQFSISCKNCFHIFWFVNSLYILWSVCWTVSRDSSVVLGLTLIFKKRWFKAVQYVGCISIRNTKKLFTHFSRELTTASDHLFKLYFSSSSSSFYDATWSKVSFQELLDFKNWISKIGSFKSYYVGSLKLVL